MIKKTRGGSRESGGAFTICLILIIKELNLVLSMIGW